MQGALAGNRSRLQVTLREKRESKATLSSEQGRGLPYSWTKVAVLCQFSHGGQDVVLLRLNEYFAKFFLV